MGNEMMISATVKASARVLPYVSAQSEQGTWCPMQPNHNPAEVADHSSSGSCTTSLRTFLVGISQQHS